MAIVWISVELLLDRCVQTVIAVLPVGKYPLVQERAGIEHNCF